MSALPKKIVDGLYSPQYIPDDLDLNELIHDKPETTAQVEASVREKLRKPVRTEPVIGDEGIPIPLTEEEAAAVDNAISSLREQLSVTRQRIEDIRHFIDKTAAPEKGKELAFTLDISNKPTLKRAVRKIFGVTTGEITYSMYKACIAAKQAIEQEEVDGYLSGEFAHGVS